MRSPLSLLFNPPTTIPMATTDDSKTRRVKEITAFIQSRSLSLNEFLIAFYSSQDLSISTQRGCCLAKSNGSRFAPEELIELWFEHCPQKSRSYLESVVINRAGKVIIRETDKACKMDSLCVPTTKLEADDLDEQFLLSKLEGIYTETLPHLWYLLNVIVTSWNNSEKRKQEECASKQSRARFVEFFLGIISPFQLSVFCDRLVSSSSAYFFLQKIGERMPSRWSWDCSSESLGLQNVS